MAKRGNVSIESIAGEVGRLFGTTESHARRWLEQRKHLLNALGSVRDRADALIGELRDGVPSPFGKRKRGQQEGIPVVQPGMRESRKKRVLSAQTRARMRAAAKARWAKIKKAGTTPPAKS